MEAVSTESGVWQESVKIHSYDVDFRKRATAEALCRGFLEAAWNHAERLGIGYADLAKQNQFWVLARLLVQVDRYPEWGDRVTLSTWPRGISSVFAIRDFELMDSNRRRLAGGVSSWLVLDSATHRPQRIDKLLLRIPNQIAPMSLQRDPAKLPTPQTSAVTLTSSVRYSDIDVNQHVNSARYVGWLLDSYPPDFHQEHSLRTLEVNYVGETLWGETISVRSQQHSPLEFSHLIVRPDGAELCRAQLEWTAESADKQLPNRGGPK